MNINPCNSVINFLKNNDELGPNEANNLCYQVCNDWLGPSNTVEGTKCYNNCKDCMLPFIKSRGKDVCSLDFKVPPIWNNITSFFPDEYKKSNNKDIAYKNCKNKCRIHNKSNIIECDNLCQLDMNALVTDENNMNQINNMKVNRINDKTKNNFYLISLICFIISIIIIFILFFKI